MHALHVTPSALQWAGWVMSTQVVPPHKPCPDGHLQAPLTHDCPPPQVVVHEPQWLGSELSFTQLVPQSEVVLSQAKPQALFVHVGTWCDPVTVQSEAEQHAEALMQVLLPGQVF